MCMCMYVGSRAVETFNKGGVGRFSRFRGGNPLPRWVAKNGVTRSTQDQEWFLTAEDCQCTELPPFLPSFSDCPG